MPARHAEVLQLQAEEPFGATLLRTEHELRKVPFVPEQCQVLFGVGAGGCTGLASQECVVAYKNQVIWTSGQSVRQRFTASSDIQQVCWANFGSKSSSSSTSTRHAGRKAGSSGGGGATPQAAADSLLHHQQRTVSLSTWLPGTHGTAAGSSTPEHQGLFGAAAAATGAGAAGGPDAAGFSPSHLPSWWTSNTPAQAAGSNSKGAAALQPPSAAAGNADKSARQAAQPTRPGASDGDGAAGAAAGSSSTQSVPECDAVLCLLLRSSITCIFPTGELLECPLLQPCQTLWPLPTGVILSGPSEAFASVLTHPLEEPLPVVADCSLSTSNTGRAAHLSISTPAAYAGWSQERVVWSSRQLHFVATHNEDRGRLSIWHIRPQPPGANSTIGSAYDLPALSPFGLGLMRTPVAPASTAAGMGSSNLPTFGSAASAGTAAGGHVAGLGSAGGGYGSATTAAAAAAAAAGYVGGPAAYSGSMLGMLASGGVSPRSGPGSFARLSVGTSTVKRSSLRSPAGRLPASIFSSTPNPQNPITGALGALGPLRPAFSNTTAAQQALLLPGPDPTLLFKLIWRQELAPGLVPDSAVQATDADGLPLLCVLCRAAQQLLAFQLPGDDEDTVSLVVKPAFSTPALAAVPVSTGALAPQVSPDSSSGPGSSRTRPVVDLLVLQPGGKLVLHRGSAALVTVRLLLPQGQLQCLQQKLAAAAALRQRWRQQHHQQLEGSGRALGAAAGGLFGVRGHRSSDEAADEEMMGTPQGADASGQASAAASICGLGGAAGDRFDVQLQLGDAQVPLRVRLGVSWLPGLPSLVLQALAEVCDAPCFNRLLAACLTQLGACCGELHAEWRAIAAVLLAWALQPDCLDALSGSSSSSTQALGQHQQLPEVSLQPWQQHQQQQQVHGGAPAGTPQSARPGVSEGSDSDDMDMATPAAAALHTLQPYQQQQQQQMQEMQTPGSGMAMSMSDMSVSMSVDTPAATPAMQRGPGRHQQQQPTVSGTPMSVSNTPLSVTSKVPVSRLRHQSSYRQEFGGQQQGQQQQDAENMQPCAATGGDAGDIFPTLPSTHPSAAAKAVAEAAAVAAAEQSFGQLQLPHTPQLAAAAAADPEAAWQQLLQTTDSSQLLQQLPCLQVPGQTLPPPAGTAAAPRGAAQLAPQQQQQHRHEVGTVLLALHSLYQDCKLSRLRLHLLQLLGPVCWLLATWLDTPQYCDHYERESSAPMDLTAAAREYALAAEQLLASVGSSSSSSAGAFAAQSHLAAAVSPPGAAAAGTAPAAAVQQQEVVEQLLQQQPADILRCLSLLLSASQQYHQHRPYLAIRGSAAVLRSLQLLQAYQVLAGGASKCAAAIAATAAASLSMTATAQQDAAAGGLGWLGGGSSSSTQDSNISNNNSSSSRQAALVCELQHILLQCSQRLVLLLVRQGWDVLALDQLPVGVVLPIKEALARCRGSPPVGWPIMAYALIGREDIAATLASNSDSSTAAAAAATCASGVSLHAPASPSKQQQQGQFEPGGAAVCVQQQGQAVQHLLLPYEQRLLLPSGTFLTGQQHHQRLPSAPNPRLLSLASRAPPARGLRSNGAATAAGIAATAAAGGSSGAAAAGGKAGGQGGGELVPIDGMEGLVNGVSALRFSRDDRLAEARSLLGTNMPVLLAPASSENDPELPAKQQAALFAAAMRTMALPLGRGALTLGLAEPLPGEHVVVPLLCLSGVVPCPAGEASGPNSSGRVLVNLDLTNAQPAPGGGAAAEVTAWCEFHNGVAAGLKIAPYRNRRHKQQQQQQAAESLGADGTGSSGGMARCRDEGRGPGSLSEGWLPHSKPAVPNYAHAGVLLALGLNGHLDRLSWTDLYRYLSDQHDATTIAVLLGMSASCRGSADSTVARMLFLHLPARHPNNFPEIELSPHVQAASLLGLGLLYQGSCHRLMTETVLEEMCRTPGVDPHATAGAGHGGGTEGAGAAGSSLSALMSVTQDREGYALAAGFGLGLICLGQGRNAPGLADLHLEDRLRNLMDAQVQPHTFSHKLPGSKPPTPDKPNSSSSGAGAAFGPGAPRNLLDHVLGPGVVPWSVEAGDDPTGLMAAAAAAGGGGSKVDADQMQQYGISQVVLEGPVVNTAVTGPAAAMALMLMYLKTGDTDVAARFKVPDTVYALDRMRPDMVTLMALGRALVLWDTIQPTEEWLRGQLSPLLDHPLTTILDNQASPAAAATGGSGSSGRGGGGMAAAGGAAGRQQAAALDWGAVGLAHVNALAGACFALGLRFAGTCSAQAEFLLRGQLLALLSAKRRAPTGCSSSAVAAATAAAAAGVAAGASSCVAHLAPGAACVGQLDKAALENALSVVLLSLSMVMAGSGHLPTFRLIQLLSRRAAPPLRPASQAAAQGPDAPPPCPITAGLGGAGVGTSSLHYGHHLAVSLAAGLLFLSGGRSSLSTSNEALAALLVAAYPLWPSSPADQRCHLQAFRHLYVLAAEPRCLEALDVHSRRQVVVPLAAAARTEALAGAAAAAAHHKQQQQQRQSVLKQWLQPTTAGELSGRAAGRQTSKQHEQQLQQREASVDAMLWSPQSTDSTGPDWTPTPAAAAAAGQQQQRLPPPAFSQGTLGGGGGGGGGGAQRTAAGNATTPPLTARLPPVSPAAAAAGGGPTSAAAAAAGGVVGSNESVDTVSLRLQAPCLLPERRHLVSLRVCGPRYWAVQLAAAGDTTSSSSSSSWSQQHLQHRICVKKKAGSLSYTDDHTGVKSLLFKAFYAGGSDTMLAAPDSPAGHEQQQQTAADGSGNSGSHAHQQQQQQHSFDIAHLCQTFAADPQIQAFAQVLQAATASSRLTAVAPGGSSSSRFLSFCSGVLFEVVVQEKTSALPAYLQLQAVVHNVCALAGGATAAAAAAAAVGGGGSGAPSSARHMKGDGSSSSSSGGVGAVLGGVSPVGCGLLLQDLMMVLSYYSSSTAVAAGMCRAAMNSGLAAAAAAAAASSSSMPQQQGGAAEVDVLMWQPLLQPGFCHTLQTTITQYWRAAHMLPRSLLCGSSSDGGSSSGSMLSQYIAAGSISGAAAAGGEGEGGAGGDDAAAAVLGAQVRRQQLLAGCLAALQLPAAVQLKQLRDVLQQQQQQGQGQQHVQKPDIATVLQLLAGQGGPLGQEVPPGSLLVLAAALV